jgi:pSer/pThr/pTyr-binding forkhead associated (FHA) protein
VPPLVLNLLKFLFLALLYLFLLRAVRIIYLDLVGPRVPRARRPQQTQRRRKGTPRMVIVNEPEASSRTFALRDSELVIGRSEKCHVKLADTYCSQLHARIYDKDGAWFVEDLGSTNGTYLNRMKVTAPSPLSAGDEVRVGKTMLEVRR